MKWALLFALIGLADRGSVISALEDFAPLRDDPRTPELAAAIDASTDSRTLRALVISVGWHETRYADDYCAGRKTGDRGKAFGCWQSWDRDRSGGLEGQARRAADHLRMAGNYCKARGYPYAQGAISLYATGSTCDWSGAAPYLKTYRNVWVKLKRPREGP